MGRTVMGAQQTTNNAQALKRNEATKMFYHQEERKFRHVTASPNMSMHSQSDEPTPVDLGEDNGRSGLD